MRRQAGKCPAARARPSASPPSTISSSSFLLSSSSRPFSSSPPSSSSLLSACRARTRPSRLPCSRRMPAQSPCSCPSRPPWLRPQGRAPWSACCSALLRGGLYFRASVRNASPPGSPSRMDQSGIEELGRLRPRLLSYALRRLRNRDQAEDAVQETLVAALEGIGGFTGHCMLTTWLFGILKYKIVDALRRTGRDDALELDEDWPAEGAVGPEAAYASRSALALIERSLARLPEKAAQAFLLREVLGLETPAICSALSVSPAYCWVLVH